MPFHGDPTENFKPTQSNNKSIEPTVVDTIGDKTFFINDKLHVNPSMFKRNVQLKVMRFLYHNGELSGHSCYRKRGGYQNFHNILQTKAYIKFDLKSTFESITYSRIVGLFRSLKMSQPVEYAKYCTFNGTLMRGSLCSNLIMEHILKRLDSRLHGLAEYNQLKYLRYADDFVLYELTSWDNIVWLIGSVVEIVQDEGFELNPKKTDIQRCPKNELLSET